MTTGFRDVGPVPAAGQTLGVLGDHRLHDKLARSGNGFPSSRACDFPSARGPNRRRSRVPNLLGSGRFAALRVRGSAGRDRVGAPGQRGRPEGGRRCRSTDRRRSPAGRHQAAVTQAAITAERSIPPPLSVAADQVRAQVPDLDDGVATGLLVIADGAAAHGGDAPAAEDPAAPEFDRALLTALAQADPDALASFCRDRAGQAAALRCESLPAWAALAGLTIGSPPTSPPITTSSSRPTTRPSGRPTARTGPTTGPTAGLIDYYGAPFGVGYIVAEWQWRRTA